jgi:hypothetical protein
VALTAEGAEFSSTDTAVTFQEDTVVKFAGAGILDVELVDRSDPSIPRSVYAESWLRPMHKRQMLMLQTLLHKTQQHQLRNNLQAIADGIADSFGVMRFTPNRLLVANTGGEDGIDYSGSTWCS